jgi:ABC-type metal ion transport system, permease component
MQNRFIYFALDKIVNIFRVIPFIILLAALIPLTRLIVGSAIGTKGAIVPLVFGTVPFFC